MSKPSAMDIMTEGVITVESETTVMEASQQMRANDIRSLVVTEDDEAVGIVAGKDLLYDVMAEGKDPTETSVGSIMTTELITAQEDDAISDIARAMIQSNISRVPIMRGKELVGMVTQTDLMNAWPGYFDLVEEEMAAGRH